MSFFTSVSALILCVVVAIAPLPFGSVIPTAIAAWSALLGLALLIVLPKRMRPAEWGFAACAAVLGAAWLMLLHEQTASAPFFSDQVSKLSNPIWPRAADLLATPLQGIVSAVRNEPYFAAGPQVVAFLALACGFLVGGDRRLARGLLLVVAWSGFGYALFGIVTFIVDPTRVFGVEKVAYRDVLTATFINRNTAAAYFGCCAISWLLLSYESLPRAVSTSSSLRQLLFAMNELSMRAVTNVLCFLVVISAMFMTNSRAGVFLSVIALAGALVVCVRRAPWFLARRFSLAVAGGAVACLAIVLMGSGMLNRFQALGLADDRWSAFRSTLAIIGDYPWLGTGNGTFAWVFPAYRAVEISMLNTWDRTHNTLLELTSDMGMPFAALVVFGWLIIFTTLIIGVLRRKRDTIFPTTALFVAFLAVAHSMVDFSLQIPGFSIVALSVIGIGLAQSFSTRESPAATSAAPIAGRDFVAGQKA